MTQRSPVIFWLLLAATISVDAIAFSWLTATTFPALHYAAAAFQALLLAQFSIVCIWSAVGSATTFWTVAAPLLAALLAALLSLMSSQGPPRMDAFAAYLLHCGLQAALLIALLWTLQRTRFWRRRTGVARPWQYSLAHLLIAMTAIAVLAAGMHNSPVVFGNDRWFNIAHTSICVLLALTSVVVWSTAWHWILKLAGTLGSAILLSAVFFLSAEGMVFSLVMGAHFLIQAVVLSAWLASGAILPAPMARLPADA